MVLVCKDESICKRSEDKCGSPFLHYNSENDSRQKLCKDIEPAVASINDICNVERGSVEAKICELPVVKVLLAQPVETEVTKETHCVSDNHGLSRVDHCVTLDDPLACQNDMVILPERFGAIPCDKGTFVVNVGRNGQSSPSEKMMEHGEDPAEQVAGMEENGVCSCSPVRKCKDGKETFACGDSICSTTADHKNKEITDLPNSRTPSKSITSWTKDGKPTRRYEMQVPEVEPLKSIAEINKEKIEASLGLACPIHTQASSIVSQPIQNGVHKQVESLIPGPSFLCFLPECQERPSISALDEAFQISWLPGSGSVSSQVSDKKTELSDFTFSSNGEKIVSSLGDLEFVPSVLTDNRNRSSATDQTLASNEDTLSYKESPANTQIFFPTTKEALHDISDLELDTRDADDLLMANAQKVDLSLQGSDHSSSSEDESAFEIYEFFESTREGNVCVPSGARQWKDKSLTSLDCASKAESRLKFSGSPNMALSSENISVSDEVKNLDLSKNESSDSTAVLGQVNKAAQLAEMGKYGDIYSISQKFEDNPHIFLGKWYDGTETADCISTTFSGPIPISGPISYPGPIPYSGSISLRSDSSTASTHSFAFPILASEWNSSPVKMAQPDRRYLRRRWRWRICCCKRPSTLFD